MKRPARIGKIWLGTMLAATTAIGGAGLAELGIGPVAAAEASVQETASIYIAPIHNAKFLAGAKFDFRVELNNWNGQASDVSILINGKNAETVFGKTFEKTSTDKSREFTIRNVSFAKPGTYTVRVKAGSLSRSVTYQVVNSSEAGQKAKNVILFIGDGMGVSSVTIARAMSKGLTEGKYNGLLEMDKLQQRAYVTTSGMDSIVTDSANSASAYMTGHKSAVNALGVYPDNTDSSLDDPKVETIAEMLKRSRGMSVGIVTTSEVEDATPASLVSHTRRRADKPQIAEMLLKLQPEVVMGGGSAYFLPKSATGSKRADETNVIDGFKNAGYSYVENAAGLKASGNPKKLLGLFHSSDMNVYYDRSTNNTAALKSFTDQPTLWDMTSKAIEVLSQNENGFFLMVEGASIDKQLHTMDWERSAYDTIEMDKAIGLARAFADKNGDTLVIATADHSHTASIAGTYQKTETASGRDALGTYEASGFPNYTDANKDGFPDSPDTDRKLAVTFGATPDYYEDYIFNSIPVAPAIKDGDKYVANPQTLDDPDAPDKEKFHHTGTLPHDESTEVHSADDVPLMAHGPGSDNFTGTMDNTEVFYAMANALGLRLDGSKPAAGNWLELSDFLSLVGGSSSFDAKKNVTFVKAGGSTIVLYHSQGIAKKNNKPVPLKFKTENGKLIVTSESLLAALGK
ncbi:alkaline phosphatase [Paenibacillus pasadenensis]|uniref:alkaline phosphatase n=1 Tax=Paenibacillus pasadenensis TaxID=217090 RepID=UPI00203F0198|nr:alkaline phosphatase [Paenibacillus pasadenensis]MCM3749536.1 alkaline phosphatase [Paenibacillus pasadenensis]